MRYIKLILLGLCMIGVNAYASKNSPKVSVKMSWTRTPSEGAVGEILSHDSSVEINGEISYIFQAGLECIEPFGKKPAVGESSSTYVVNFDETNWPKGCFLNMSHTQDANVLPHGKCGLDVTSNLINCHYFGSNP